MKKRTQKYLTFRKNALGEIKRLRDVLKYMSKEFADQQQCHKDLENDDEVLFWQGWIDTCEQSIYP